MLVIPSERLRCLLRFLIPFVLIPSAVLVGALAFDAKRHLIISDFVAILTLLLFVAGFEKKTTGTRRMVLVAVLIALSVAGRFIPFFKPVTALTVIAAVWLGGESGFGQGPWTPFQMLAWGLIGLFGGFLASPLRKSRALLLLYGVLSGIVYSLIMDVWNVLWYNGSFRAALYGASVLAALPHTLLYAASNFLFLWLGNGYMVFIY